MEQNTTDGQYDEEIEELIEQFDEGGLSRREAEAYVVREVIGKTRLRAAETLGIKRGTFDSLYGKANNKITALLEALEKADRAKGGTSDAEPFDSVEEFKQACIDHEGVSDRMVETIDWEVVDQMVDNDDEFLTDARRALTGGRPFAGSPEENLYRLLMTWDVAPDQKPPSA